MGQLEFCAGLGDRLLALMAIDKYRLVGIAAKAAIRLVDGVRRDRVELLPAQFFQRGRHDIPRLRGKANQPLMGLFALGQIRHNIRHGGQFQRIGQRRFG